MSNSKSPSRLRPWFCLLLFYLTLPNVSFAGGVVTVCDEANLRAALAGGGTVTFAASGTIQLANTLEITNATTIDATGYSVILSGSNTVRIFTVANPVTLSLNNLALTSGQSSGTNGAPGVSGGSGNGGGVWGNGATLTAVNCTFLSNHAVGGLGGTYNGSVIGEGGPGYGGAIYLADGILRLTNCAFLGNVAGGGEGGSAAIPFGPLTTGGKSLGGALFTTNSDAIAVNCQFLTNQAVGGTGGVVGTTVGPSGKSGGGSIFNEGGSWILRDSRFEANRAYATTQSVFGGLSSDGSSVAGGAIVNEGGTFSIFATEFVTNTAAGGHAVRNGSPGEGLAGAVFNTGQMDLTACTFKSNSVSGGNNGFAAQEGKGGAIFNGGSMRIAQSDLQANSALGGVVVKAGAANGPGKGGAIYSTNSLVIVQSTLANNSASGRLGSSFAIPSGFIYPSAGFGGALMTLGSCSITNVTFATNNAFGGSLFPAGSLPAPGDAYGGAIFNQGALSVANATFSGNGAFGGTNSVTNGIAYGGAICLTNGTASLLNTILANSPSGSNSFGVLTDLGNNLSSDASCNFTGPGSLNNTDPVLAPLANYGGPTPTMALLSGSPAINGGSASSFPSTDQRGHARPFGPASDIGAFESSPPYVIRGKISGKTLSEEVVINSGVSTTGTMNGSYSLEGLGADTYAVTPQSANYLFLPSQQSITVGPDKLGVNFSAYHWNALSLDEVTGGNLHVVYAGTNGHTFRLQTSPDLKVWSTVSTNTVVSGNYLDMLLPIGTEAAKFHRTVTP